ncbi:MAG: hypothetical protein IJA35_04720 [Clostridia bacterium]|nr:hypothetical protein [Clostridia bacterium]
MLFNIGMQELLLVLIVLAITVALLAVIGKKSDSHSCCFSRYSFYTAPPLLP